MQLRMRDVGLRLLRKPNGPRYCARYYLAINQWIKLGGFAIRAVIQTFSLVSDGYKAHTHVIF